MECGCGGPPASPPPVNLLGAVAALERGSPSLRRRPSVLHRTFSPITAGGLRQSTITLVQTSLGGGVLALAYAVRLAGVGVGLALMLFTALVAFLGMDIVMRGAIKLEAYSTANLLKKCVGDWSGPAMDVLLAVYGNGSMIAYFILLGDFLPAACRDLGLLPPPALASAPQPLDIGPSLRTRCILASLIVIVPLSIPRKLSALRYATPVALVSITCTSATVIAKAPGLFMEHLGRPGFGGVGWASFDSGFFKAFSILLFAYNCHINVVPVAAEMVSPSDGRITRVALRCVLVEVLAYGLISLGGYLSFLEATAPNIMSNYESGAAITVCRLLLSCTVLVGIPTVNNPTVRSLQGALEAALPGEEKAAPLLPCGEPGAEARGAGAYAWRGSAALRLALTALCLLFQVSASLLTTNVADVMGFIGALMGTFLMMLLPLVVLLKAPPAEYSGARWAFAVFILLGSAVLAVASMLVMLLQKLGVVPG